MTQKNTTVRLPVYSIQLLRILRLEIARQRGVSEPLAAFVAAAVGRGRDPRFADEDPAAADAYENRNVISITEKILPKLKRRGVCVRRELFDEARDFARDVVPAALVLSAWLAIGAESLCAECARELGLRDVPATRAQFESYCRARGLECWIDWSFKDPRARPRAVGRSSGAS